MPIYQHYSRKLRATLTLTMPENGGYIKYLDGAIVFDHNDQALVGTPNTFEKQCKAWVRNYVSNQLSTYRIESGKVFRYRNGAYYFDGMLDGRTLAQYHNDMANLV